MMENLLILGHPRGGKSLFTKILLQKNPNYNLISLDYLRSAFKDVFPENGISSDMAQTSRELFAKFVFTYLNRFMKYDKDLNFIMEGDSIDINLAVKYFDEASKIIVVGKPEIKPDALFNEVRSNEKKFGGWTTSLSDDELLGKCRLWIDRAKTDREQTRQNGLLFIDTSHDYDDFTDVIGRLK